MDMTGLFIFFGGCQREDVNINIKENESKLKRRFEIDPSFLQEEGHQSKIFIIDQPYLHRKVVKSFNNLNTRSGLFKLSDIQFSGYAKVGDSSHTVFSFILNTTLKDRFFHYIFEKDQNINIREYVLEIKPSNFATFDGNMYNFTGTISKISFEAAFNTAYRSSSSRGDEHYEIIYCWQLLFENGIDKNIFNDPQNQGGSLNSGGGSGGNYSFICVPCPCQGHTCSQRCRCKTPPFYRIILKSKIKSNNESGSRNDVEECYRFLIDAGIISPPPGVGRETDTNDQEGSIANQLGVSQECINKLDKSARFAVAEMLKNSNFIFPCDPSKSSVEILGEAVAKACESASGKVSKSAIEDALAGEDYIDLSELPLNLLDCNKTSEENLADFNNFMQQNGGCDHAGIGNALSKYLGFGSTLNLNVPPISASHKMCPNSIIIKPSSWGPTRQNVAGLTGLQISINNGKGGSVPLTFSNLFFKIDQTGDCGISTAQLISDAINSAILIAEQNLEKGIPIFKNGLDDYNSQFVRLVETELKRIATNLGCTPKGDPKMNQTTGGQSFYTSVVPSNYANSIGRDYHCGAQFVKFENMQTGCP